MLAAGATATMEVWTTRTATQPAYSDTVDYETDGLHTSVDLNARYCQISPGHILGALPRKYYPTPTNGRPFDTRVVFDRFQSWDEEQSSPLLTSMLLLKLTATVWVRRYEHFEVYPQPGTLVWASLSLPMLRGNIILRFNQTASTLNATLAIPQGSAHHATFPSD